VASRIDGAAPLDAYSGPCDGARTDTSGRARWRTPHGAALGRRSHRARRAPHASAL